MKAKVCAMALAMLALAGALTVPARAQDPVGGALATLSAATRQAEYWRQASQATAQAAQWQAAQAATATAQAQDAAAQATRTALDDLAGKQAAAATATSRAQDAAATAMAGAYQAQAAATATSVAVQAGATSTAAAQDAAATAAAYDLAHQQSLEQAGLGRTLLYLTVGMSLIGLIWVILAWGGALARRFKSIPSARAAWNVAGGVTVDVEVHPIVMPALPGPTVRMPEQMRVISDPELGSKIEAWFYGSDDDENS